MLGTILLIGMLICGYLHFSLWILVPATIIATFIGMHFPSGKAQMAQQRGIYWRTLIVSFPLQAVFMIVLFGLGWGMSILFGN